MPTESRILMVEHPGWVAERTRYVRAVGCGFCSEPHLLTARVARGSRAIVGSTSFSAALLIESSLPEELVSNLARLGTVVRFRNPCLWDAIGTAILRQVIRAAHSRDMYRRFSQSQGVSVGAQNTVAFAFPSPGTVLELTDAEFAELGMRFKMRPLRQAAERFVEYHGSWREATPPQLKEALQEVPGIGRWTAGAAVADWSNDWSLYPFEDLAIRKWSAHASPNFAWPQSETSFATMWRDLTGPHRSEATALTLAWGSRHGIIG